MEIKKKHTHLFYEYQVHAYEIYLLPIRAYISCNLKYLRIYNKINI